MKNTLNSLLPVLCLLLCISFARAESTLEGRWDITITMAGKSYPSWLEVQHSGSHTLVGRFVGVVGSARPISRINVDGNKFSFAIPPQWEEGTGDMTLEGSMDEKGLSGTIVFPNGKSFSWTAVRAPSLRVEKAASWGKPVTLIQGNTMKGWHALGDNQWVVEQGILRSPKSGANLVTDEKFTDFKLHIEFRYPKGSNSGVYLRGRYEVQIDDGQDSRSIYGQAGGVYGFIAPSEPLPKTPGEWQTYDITFVGRMITVVANGKTVIANQEIPGTTGGALDSNEAEPGPLLLQGDHGPIEFRNIVITRSK